MRQPLLDVDAAQAARSQLAAFMRRVAQRAGREFADVAAFHRWSCEHYRDFWSLWLEQCRLDLAGTMQPACKGSDVERAQFFPDLRLNFARQVLRDLPDAPGDAVAIVARSEDGGRRQWSRAELRRKALGVAAWLRARGVQPGDRVVGIARNSPEAVAACLGATAIGAAWSSVSPDLGIEAILDRFRQLEPRVLLADLVHRHHGAVHSQAARLRQLTGELPSLQNVIWLGDGSAPTLRPDLVGESFDACAETPALALEALDAFPFNHPLYILFSSGTTGKPKCIVHGAGGTLLEHLKEHRLHTDLSVADRLFFVTAVGWMMWNWQLTALASGSSIVLYDGSATYPDATALLRVLAEESVTVFGTSPAWVQMLIDAGIEPRTVSDFPSLRVVQSTGSILYDRHFEWLHAHLKPVPIHSISGGTDILGCFVLGNPLLPVFRGESQSVSLAMDVRAHDGTTAARTGSGELICLNPFPSRPVGIWNDPDGARFHDSYFAGVPGVWNHGDRIELMPEGSARILGRTDGTLKIRGVRIGPAELYSVVLSIPGIREAMAIAQSVESEPGGQRIVLLVVTAPGVVLDRALVFRIKRELKEKASAVHVPGLVVQVSELPQTHNGKYSERAAQDAVNGKAAPNLAALRNPACLAEISRAVAAPAATA